MGLKEFVQGFKKPPVNWQALPTRQIPVEMENVNGTQRDGAVNELLRRADIVLNSPNEEDLPPTPTGAA